MEPLLDANGLAALLGVSRKSLYDKLYRGFLPQGIKIGRLIRWKKEDIEAWLEDIKKKQSA